MSAVPHTYEPGSEHEVLTYIRVGRNINMPDANLNPMDMKKNTPLTKALDSMSCVPFVRFPARFYEDLAFTVSNVAAGTVYEPNVKVILDKSAQSSFGRGSETVLDPSYRSGQEIPAADIGINHKIPDALLYDVKRLMFPGREVNLKLYKLAVYETGGHFDWHMDSTHSDQHQATLLVALNTSWDGGDLVLRRKGVETLVDLRPQRRDLMIELQAVVFYTDTEHRVEPVKSGVRIVLQYDIQVSKKPRDDEKDKKEGNKKVEGADEESEEGNEEEEQSEAENEEDGYEPWMDKIMLHYSKRLEVKDVAQTTAGEAAQQTVISIIKKMHGKGAKEVAFALQHLYRSASISAEYLKGSDATLYNALLASGHFDVSLHPVILCEDSGIDQEGYLEDRFVYRYNAARGVKDDSSASPSPRKSQKRRANEFHVPKLSAIVEISRQDYIEYTGNEAMSAEYRYFGGGMFVRPKAK
ncbi:hypothetical protein GALMADRAFT_258670 [Galerina marginata CBS 339.88]|uniref:Fe2OG dioxygenase domain-containing protein n=1 Tax=Galerina marginata (strain CBS 339.88) TaxID=685588 RepID=A0A067S808_GALM3|nr:hypothetical protein GALMADRAFT_258670 [Galerina marginata CBS 339.88]